MLRLRGIASAGAPGDRGARLCGPVAHSLLATGEPLGYELAPRLNSRWWASIGLLGCLMGASAVTPVLAQSAVEGEPVIAAFVHRFAQFVEWPAAALQDRDQFSICVAASADFMQTVQGLVDGSQIGGRPLIAREAGPGDLEGCHVLFVSADVDRVDAFVEAAAGQPILTVSDSAGFLDMDGMIEFRIIDRRIRFGVSAAAANRAGLRFSSQLLDLAIEVRGGPL